LFLFSTCSPRLPKPIPPFFVRVPQFFGLGVTTPWVCSLSFDSHPPTKSPPSLPLHTFQFSRLVAWHSLNSLTPQVQSVSTTPPPFRFLPFFVFSSFSPILLHFGNPSHRCFFGPTVVAFLPSSFLLDVGPALVLRLDFPTPVLSFAPPVVCVFFSPFFRG